MNANESTKINILPVPTWNHLNINDVDYVGASSAEEIFEGIKKINIEPSGSNPVIYDFDEDFDFEERARNEEQMFIEHYVRNK